MKHSRRAWTAGSCVLSLAIAGPALGQGADYVDENGMRFRVTTQTVPTAVPVTKTQERQITTYRQEVKTEQVQHQQVYNVPVTQYQLVPRLHGRWNPFATPYWTYEYEPVTVWQQQVATVQVPVTRAAWTPETRTVQQPVTVWETHNQTIVTKTPVGPTQTQPLGGGGQQMLAAQPQPATPSATLSPAPAAGSSTALASQPYGGQAMTADPPKTGWQPPPSNVPATAASPRPRY